MSAQPVQREYSVLSKWLHWGSMFLIFGLVGAGLLMVGLEDGDPQKQLMYRTHGVIGLLIVLATLARLIIRWRQPTPLPDGLVGWQAWAYKLTHWGIYLVLLALGTSGMSTLVLNGVMAFNVDPAALNREVPSVAGHYLFSRLIMLLVVLHLAGVFQHQFTHNDVLSRMGLRLPIGKK